MNALWLLALVPSLAALAALVVPGAHRDGLVRAASLAPLLAVPLAVAGPVAGPLDLPWLLLGTHLQVDAVGRPLLLVAALLYTAALAGTAQAVPERRGTFAAFLLACWLGNAGVFLAADPVTFYLSFAVMGFCAYGLVIHDRTAKARRAGRIYLVLTVFGELVLLSGLLLTVGSGASRLADVPATVAASPARDAIVVLLVTGFGIKAGLVPLHFWLPLAHPAAPVPASAVLSGCMVKAGLVGMLRFLPLGETAMPRAGALVGGLALAAAFLAVAVGLTQRDPKANLAYSTISQMGFHLVLVGVALAAPDLAPSAVAAAVLYAVHHGIAKGALFLGVAVHKAYGGSRARVGVTAGLALTALAVAGAPFTSGAAAKYSAKEAIGEAGVAGVQLVTVLPLVAVGTTLLLARFLRLLPDAPPSRVRAGTPGLLASWTALVVLGAPLTWWLAPQWLADSPAPSATWGAAVTSAWPVLLALALVGLALRSRRLRDVGELPPGDVVVVLESGVRGARRVATAAGRARPVLRPPGVLPWVTTVVGALERRLVDWRASGAAVLVVLSLLALAAGAS